MSNRYISDAGDDWIPDLTPTYIQKLSKDPLPSGVYRYRRYRVQADRTYFILWARLEKSNDPEKVNGPSSTRNATPPAANFNYCLEPPQ